MKQQKAVIVLADGFEEIEAITPIDVLRRMEVEVAVLGLASRTVRGAHGITVTADGVLREAVAAEIGVLMLPGGMPGAKNLRDSEALMALLRRVYQAGGYVAAICAAPIALARSGLIEGRRVTVYPGFENMLGGAVVTGNPTEVDGRIITGRGPGAALEFTRHVAAALGREREVGATMQSMLISQ
ncbi:MAG: DJ-1/PfpI family protein [Victivallales bacterium]|nr:DJ-1/PfpI family protein [Victivallales bacterium]